MTFEIQKWVRKLQKCLIKINNKLEKQQQQVYKESTEKGRFIKIRCVRTKTGWRYRKTNTQERGYDEEQNRRERVTDKNWKDKQFDVCFVFT